MHLILGVFERTDTMEFHEKLQQLRKNKDLTQEELAQALYVSRTAISKWESGRGYPNIDSLKAIASFFGVTIDTLLSGDEVLTIAEADQKRKERSLRDLVFGLLDLSAVLFFFLPLLGQQIADNIQAVSLLSLTQTAVYLRVSYFAIVITMTVWGILTLALQKCTTAFWQQVKTVLSCIVHAVGLLLFIISQQPYAAALLLFLLAIKVLMLLKKR